MKNAERIGKSKGNKNWKEREMKNMGRSNGGLKVKFKDLALMW